MDFSERIKFIIPPFLYTLLLCRFFEKTVGVHPHLTFISYVMNYDSKDQCNKSLGSLNRAKPSPPETGRQGISNIPMSDNASVVSRSDMDKMMPSSATLARGELQHPSQGKKLNSSNTLGSSSSGFKSSNSLSKGSDQTRPQYTTTGNKRGMNRAQSSVLTCRNDIIVRDRLNDGAFHLPGNNWWQDLYQYNINTHPLFGICWHHPLHPIRRGVRLAALFGSVAFGLAITNIVALFFLLNDNNALNKSYYHITIIDKNVTHSSTVNNQVDSININTAMILLWTVGGALHALYDNTIWAVASCSWFAPGGKHEDKRRFRIWLILFLVLIGVVGATLVTLILAITEQQNGNDDNSGGSRVSYVKGAQYYRFLVAYSIELVGEMLLWYPIVGTLLFSGILGCWKLPLLGGRAAELKMEAHLDQKALEKYAASPASVV